VGGLAAPEAIRAFLGHTLSVDVAKLKVSQARTTLLKKNPVIDHEPVKFFPADRMVDLLFKGFIVPGKQKSPRIEERLNLRDILITMLMHYGGLRMSEPFHLYMHDVTHDDTDPGNAWSRCITPVSGKRRRSARCKGQAGGHVTVPPTCATSTACSRGLSTRVRTP
jgi:hypothetical protein